MSAVLFGLLAGVCFGALAIATRSGLVKGGAPEAGALVTAVVGTVVSLLVALAAGVEASDVDLAELWPFVALGVAVPGATQLLFIQSVRHIGPSRSAVIIGTAPLISALLAVAFLDERPHVALGVGTVLIVLGGVALAGERIRPQGFRILGVALALTCAALFGARDNVARWAATDNDVSPLAASTASLLAAATSVLAYLLFARRKQLVREFRGALVPFLPAGLALGLAYDALIWAFDRGRVTVVAPLNATQALWAVLFAALVIGKSEALGKHLVLAACLVVAGSALIGAFR